MNRSSIETRLNDLMRKQFESNSVPCAFPEDIDNLTAADLEVVPCENRVDLRHLPCLTIDCDHTKDMDDAISLLHIDGGYELGVHIADVSAYVTPGSFLDEVATERGSSIYLENNKTIPMLPQVLSNDLCSLNPNQDRNVISVLIRMTEDGTVQSYDIMKAVIHSRMKGVYSEINSIFARTASPEIIEKYDELIPMLQDLRTISERLMEKRRENGANICADDEVIINLDGDNISLELIKRGCSEALIEELMVLANRTVAEYCFNNDLPCLYRTQLEKNSLAQYKPHVDSHFELGLEYYVHFTSPIRRLADLRVHQVLTDWLGGMSLDELHDIYDEFIEESAEIATKRFRRAQTMQKISRDFCYSCYFSKRYRDIYVGKIVGYTKTHQPIIRMDDFPINVLGSAALSACTGDKIAFHVSADVSNRKLYAVAGRKVA